MSEQSQQFFHNLYGLDKAVLVKANYEAASHEDHFLVDVSAGNVVLKLPRSSVVPGHRAVVEVIVSGNNLTITAPGVIKNVSQTVTVSVGDAFLLESTGNRWIMVSGV